jgi:MFS family permease
VASIVVGSLTRYIRKTVSLILVTFFTMLLLGYLYYWTPSSAYRPTLYVFAVLFGAFESAWGPIMMTLVGVLFSNNAGFAYANNRFCQSLFFMIPFIYSKYLSVAVKIYICMAFGVVAIVSLIILDCLLNKELKYMKVNGKELPTVMPPCGEKMKEMTSVKSDTTVP